MTVDTTNTTETPERHLLPLCWSVENDRLSIGSVENRPFSMAGLTGSVMVDNREVSLTDAKSCTCIERQDDDGNRECTVEFVLDDPDLLWVWRLTQRQDSKDSSLSLTAGLRNTGAALWHVGNWNVLEARGEHGGSLDPGTKPDQVRFFGWRPWRMQVELLGTEENGHSSNNFCHLYDPATETTFLCGFVTLDRMLVSHDLMYDEGDGVSSYRATCSFGRYTLQPGAELKSESLHIGYYDNPYAALENWADRVHRIYKPSFRAESEVAWGGGAWIDGFSDQEDPWETVIEDNARALREKLKGFKIDMLTGTSHKMYKDGLPGNWLNIEEKQFPNGFEAMFAKLESMGFTHKFWFSPFWFFEEAAGVLEENRENLLRDGDGNAISEPAEWEFDLHAEPDGRKRLTKYYLDGTHPRTKEYVRRIFEAYRKLGVRSYMLDFLSIKENAKLFDQSLLPVEAARKIIEVIREAAGDDTHLQTAVASTPGYIGLIDSARVGRDFGEGRPMFPPYNTWRNSTYVLHDEHFGNTRFFVQNAAVSYFTHRKIYINDFNMLTIDKPVPIEHARIAVTLFGLGGGSPMTLGDDFRTIDPDRLKMTKLCLPRTSEVPKPVDLFDRVAPEDYCRILKLDVSTSWDSYTIAAVFNLDEEEYSTDLVFEKLGLRDNAAYRIFDFWNEEYVGTFSNSFRCRIPGGACRVYRISHARPHPWLLATDMHMQQGRVEISSLTWDQASMTLSGTATRPAGEVGNLFVHMPRTYKLVNHKRANTMKDVRDMCVVVRIPLYFETNDELFRLQFEVMDTPYVSRKGWLPYASVREWLEYVDTHRKSGDTRVVE